MYDHFWCSAQTDANSRGEDISVSEQNQFCFSNNIIIIIIIIVTLLCFENSYTKMAETFRKNVWKSKPEYAYIAKGKWWQERQTGR
jgi:hypothetical protein